jgi:hypothetical protein
MRVYQMIIGCVLLLSAFSLFKYFMWTAEDSFKTPVIEPKTLIARGYLPVLRSKFEIQKTSRFPSSTPRDFVGVDNVSLGDFSESGSTSARPRSDRETWVADEEGSAQPSSGQNSKEQMAMLFLLLRSIPRYHGP